MYMSAVVCMPFPGAGVTGRGYLPDVGTGDTAPIFFKNRAFC